MNQMFPDEIHYQDSFYQERVDLAAAFRWTARCDMHESIANHFSYEIKGTPSKILINPYGIHFSQIKASDLLLLDRDEEPAGLGERVDPTAWAIHSAMHRKVPQARCLMHLHPKYATAMACLKDPSLPPIDQNTMRFYGRVALDQGFDGLGLGDEAERLPETIGNKSVLMMGNHGVMTTGDSIAFCFDEIYYFERACQTVITALSSGRELRLVDHKIAEKTCQQFLEYPSFAEKHLNAIKAILDKEEPDYRC